MIDHSVSQIDAVLIAMPDNNLKTTSLSNALSKGRIHTCHIDSVHQPMTDCRRFTRPGRPDRSGRPKGNTYASSINGCLNYLTINGALIARQIRLGRTTRSATTQAPNFPVSEEINLWPAYSIGRPLLPTYDDWLYGSDSITILPVNF